MKKLIYFLVSIFLIELTYAEISLEISEIYPNPVGKDKGNESEFIEIHNFGNLSISLKGIRLKNNNNKSIELSHFYNEIKAYEYLVFYPSFNLKNINEKIKLFYGNEFIDKFEYNQSIEGMSWVKIENEWYIGKKSAMMPNFKNISIIEYKINCSNKSIIKAENLLNDNKVIYKSKKSNLNTFGLYIFLMTLFFLVITLFIEKWKEKK